MARYSLAGAIALALAVSSFCAPARAQLSSKDAASLLKKVKDWVKTGQHEKAVEELAGGNDIRATKMMVELAKRWTLKRIDSANRAVPIEGLMPAFERAFSRINDPESWKWLYKEFTRREFDKLELMWVRFAAAKGLAMKPEDHAYDKLVVMLRHKDPALQLAGAWGLQERYGDLRSKEASFEAMKSDLWQVRYLGILGLMRSRAALVENTTFLEALERSSGRERADMLRGLRTLTAKAEWKLDDWKAWIAKLDAGQRAQFRADYQRFMRDPSQAVSRREAMEIEAGKRQPFDGPTVFGVKLQSRRVAFVVDLHEGLREIKPTQVPAGTKAEKGDLSMRDFIREEVARAIESLPDGMQVAAFLCDTDITSLEGKLVAVDDKVRKGLAKDFREARSYTRSNLFDAFDEVYAMYDRDYLHERNLTEGPDTVVLITPGTPETGEIAYRKVTMKGKLPWDQDFLRRWRAVHRARQVRFHVVAVGPQAQTTFLRRLADRSAGAFVHLR